MEFDSILKYDATSPTGYVNMKRNTEEKNHRIYN